MSNMEDVLTRVKKIFDLIEAATSIDKLNEIQNQFTIEEMKKNFPSEKYPQLRLSLSNDDIEQLKTDGFLDEDGSISKKCANGIELKKTLTPLEKLLYSVLWKNGDLGKEKHISDGVLENRDSKYIKGETGLVFYYFGQHLKDKKKPIIDQHVIRAFKLYQALNDGVEDIDKILKMDTLNAKDKDTCLSYIKWQNEHKLKESNPIEFTYHLDRLLFGLGKTLKKTVSSKATFEAIPP